MWPNLEVAVILALRRRLGKRPPEVSHHPVYNSGTISTQSQHLWFGLAVQSSPNDAACFGKLQLFYYFSSPNSFALIIFPLKIYP